jgi:hypothetical protein
MSVIPEPITELVLDREVVYRLALNLISFYEGTEVAQRLVAGKAKASFASALTAYTYALELIGLPNHGTRFALLFTVQDVFARHAGIHYKSPRIHREHVAEEVTDRLMGITTADFPEGLAPDEVPAFLR